MHPVQDQVNTGDRLLDTKANWNIIFDMKGKVFQPGVLQLNLDNIDSRTANTPSEKNGEWAGTGLEPTTFCMQGRLPNH